MAIIIGLDEVGRGAWAGPLVVGAVALKVQIPGLADSKQLSKKQREQLDEAIRATAIFVGIGWVSPQEVDDLGLTKATSLGCERATKDAPNYAEIIIDGKINYLHGRNNTSTLVNGDDKVPAISAASIVAKVARDRYMVEQDAFFPGYRFASNVGYGTGFHFTAINSLGLTPLHRWSFGPIRKLLDTYET